LKISGMGEGLNRPPKGAYKMNGLDEDVEWPKANEMGCEVKTRLDGTKSIDDGG
jgi:hypothetical protein